MYDQRSGELPDNLRLERAFLDAAGELWTQRDEASIGAARWVAVAPLALREPHEWAALLAGGHQIGVFADADGEHQAYALGVVAEHRRRGEEPLGRDGLAVDVDALTGARLAGERHHPDP